MKKRKIIPYNPKLKELARNLRNNSTPSEIRLWKYLKGKQFHGYDFHRQKPIDEYIVDLFCQELMLAIELDGRSHSLEEIQKKDYQKERALNKLGIRLLRFSDDQVFNEMKNVMRSIEAHIENTEHTPATSTIPLTPSQEGNTRMKKPS
ncbi:MAG: endonuclease domain-containing protein [Flavobacteriales bacterium]|nr:endonuclease domain-containing protein [Flavobacteriales bacterium]